MWNASNDERSGGPGDTPDFTKRLEQVITAAETARARQSREMETTMAEREAAERKFEQMAVDLFGRVIRPRVEALTSGLGAMPLVRYEMDQCQTAVGVHTRCVFARTTRFPATTTLTVGVLHDQVKGGASVFCRVEVVPVLFDFTKEDHLDISLDAPDEQAVAQWVGDRLLRFLDLYLSLETDPRYQAQNVVQDPVCGMQVSGAVAEHHVEHHRHTYHFCSQTCRDKFVADPDFYLQRGATVREA